MMPECPTKAEEALGAAARASENTRRCADVAKMPLGRRRPRARFHRGGRLAHPPPVAPGAPAAPPHQIAPDDVLIGPHRSRAAGNCSQTTMSLDLSKLTATTTPEDREAAAKALASEAAKAGDLSATYEALAATLADKDKKKGDARAGALAGLRAITEIFHALKALPCRAR